MARWETKWAVRQIFGGTRVGVWGYWWATAGLLRTQRAMPAKWCQWFREHVLLARRHTDLALHGANVWVIDPGFTVTPALLCRLLSDGEILLTDRWPRLRSAYQPAALATVRERFAGLAHSMKREEDRLRVLDGLPERDQGGLLVRIGARYVAPAASERIPAEDGSVDFCLSMGALEHFPPEELRALVAEMARVIRPGGVTSHIVDHRDHLFHGDPTKDCFYHLRFTDEFWRRVEGNPLLHLNRFLRSDYLALLEQAGFEVRYAGHGLHEGETTGVVRERLWGRYREASEEDLRAAVSHFLAVRR